MAKISENVQNTHNLIEQFAVEVIDFSSQYGSEKSISYTVSNLAGSTSIFPRYGDFTQACVLRTYGSWWKQSPSAEKGYIRTPIDFISQDYIDLRYNEKVYPTSIEIYETYNPGCVVRILACDCDTEDVYNSTDHVRWFVLWSGRSACREGRSNKFVPKLRTCPFTTHLIRLEFNSDHCVYYTELDAVKLIGRPYTSDTVSEINDQCLGASNKSEEQICPLRNVSCLPCVRSSRPNSGELYREGSSVEKSAGSRPGSAEVVSENSIHVKNASSRPSSGDSYHGTFLNDHDGICANEITQGIAQLHLQDGLSAALDGSFDILPGEVIQHIVSYLDLPSLGNLAAACQLLHRHCYDPHQYYELNLQPFWTQVTDASLDGLMSRCCHLQRLNLAWCGNYNHITTQGYQRFITSISKELTCLNLACCKFMNADNLKTTVEACDKLQELNLQSCREIPMDDFAVLKNLPQLRRLNLYRTLIQTETAMVVIRSCKNLEHVNLGACKNIHRYNDVTKELGQNCRQLKSLDLWRGSSISLMGIKNLCDCSLLEELDLGWCPQVLSATGCIVEVAESFKRMKKLFLTANRAVNDRDLNAIASHLKDLEQLDILGTNDVTEAGVARVLNQCSKLKFFDISFCMKLRNETVRAWKDTFPNVSIKRSFQDNNNGEFEDDDDF